LRALPARHNVQLLCVTATSRIKRDCQPERSLTGWATPAPLSRKTFIPGEDLPTRGAAQALESPAF